MTPRIAELARELKALAAGVADAANACGLARADCERLAAHIGQPDGEAVRTAHRLESVERGLAQMIRDVATYRAFVAGCEAVGATGVQE
jgi:hypothetical protein